MRIASPKAGVRRWASLALFPCGLAEQAIRAVARRRFAALRQELETVRPRVVWPPPSTGGGFYASQLSDVVFGDFDFVAVARARRRRLQLREEQPDPCRQGQAAAASAVGTEIDSSASEGSGVSGCPSWF